jgi:Ran GTPase-activating protein (RanGAP) involved in mRNA processing and transport
VICWLRLATNTKLKYLELNGNSLGVAAAEELVKGLQSNKTLEKFLDGHYMP